MQRSKISKRVLLSGVALFACISMVSAQGHKEPGSPGSPEHGASSQPAAPATSQRAAERPGRASAENNARAIDHKASSQSERQTKSEHEPNTKAANGQAPSQRRERSTTGQGSSDKSEAARASASKAENYKPESRHDQIGQRGNSAQRLKNDEKLGADQRSNKKNDRSTVGQSADEGKAAHKSQPLQGRSPAHAQQPAQTQSSSRQSEQSQTKSSEVGERNRTTGTAATEDQKANGASQPGATQQAKTANQPSGTSLRSEAGTTISTEQQSKLQQSVLSAHNVPRVNDVNFDIRTHARVPSHVHVVTVSSFPVLAEAFPRYRDDSFFVVEDEIVIVDHSHRIVDVVPAGPRARFAHRGSSTATSVGLDLSEPEIRELQQVLIERGYYHGRVDGVFGAEMREALITFQRKEGFDATGRIDSRTVSALGLSDRIGQKEQGTANQSANQTGMQNTSGQSGTTGQAAGQGDRSQNQPTTTGTNKAGREQASASNQASPSKQPVNKSSQNDQRGPKPSTTGQGAKPETSHGGEMKGQGGTPQKRSSSDK